MGLALVVDGDVTEADGHAAARRLPAERPEFDAVFAHDDLAAVGVLGAPRDAGIRVPDDVAVIGFDDIPVARHTEPSLNSVRRPVRETGRRPPVCSWPAPRVRSLRPPPSSRSRT